MAWTERQHRLLAAMGLRLLSPPAAEGVSVAEPPAAEPAPAPVAPPAAAARPTVTDRGALPALGWPELREAVAACRACGLCERRTQTVFGVGSPQAQWMVVGEAPGEQEDREGEPFVGAAGQLLDRMLAALQLTRAQEPGTPPERQVYIANTLKCRPPGNRNPAPDELAKCEPFLVRQIELLQPRIILAMGRFAVQALLRSDEPIGRLRGRVHRYQGVPLVVTYHPAYLLRSLPEKAKAWDDLCLAAEVFERPPAG
ncbi:MAG: uracil-DNA glycosylase family protein [Rubrivivax sp.]